MSFIDTIKRWWGGADNASLSGPSNILHVIDGSCLSGGNGGRERISPRDQFTLLQQVATFVEKEQLRACVVLEGRPLREAPDGATFKTLQVHYVDDAGDLPQRAVALARGAAMVITQNRELESAAMARGISTMRGTSLRKAMEENSGRGSGDSGRGGAGRNRRRRPRRSERRPDTAGQTPSSQKAPQAADGVSDLIDLV